MEIDKLHKGYRCSMAKDYLYDAEGNPNYKPPSDKEHRIKEDELRVFVDSCLDTTFMIILTLTTKCVLSLIICK